MRESENESESERRKETDRERLQEDSLCGWRTENLREVQKVSGSSRCKSV